VGLGETGLIGCISQPISPTARRHRSEPVAHVGVDTVSFAWRLDDDIDRPRLARAVSSGQIYDPNVMPSVDVAGEPEHATQAGVVLPSGRGSGMLRDALRGARWILAPRHNLIYAEGRLAAIRAMTRCCGWPR